MCRLLSGEASRNYFVVISPASSLSFHCAPTHGCVVSMEACRFLSGSEVQEVNIQTLPLPYDAVKAGLCFEWSGLYISIYTRVQKSERITRFWLLLQSAQCISYQCR